MIKKLLYILLCLIFITSCKVIEPKERIIYKTDTVHTHQRDSIFYYYSDTIREKQKDDTIYIEQIKWRTAYKEFLRCDTIIKTDSIFQKDVVIQYKMNGFQRSFFWVGILLSILLLLLIAWKIYKKFYLHL